MAEIDSQLTALDSAFAWKGTFCSTRHGGLGGGGSGSAIGGIVHVGLEGGGSGSATRGISRHASRLRLDRNLLSPSLRLWSRSSNA